MRADEQSFETLTAAPAANRWAAMAGLVGAVGIVATVVLAAHR